MNWYAIKAIYLSELARTWRTPLQSLASPVISTSLYFIVFGAAIGTSMTTPGDISYGAFIVPGLVMLLILTESTSNASFGIYIPKWSGSIYEVLSAPVSAVEIVTGYVGAAISKSLILSILVLITAAGFVDYSIQYPLWMLLFLILTAATFSLLGFVIGLLADGFDKLQTIPLMIITPMAFLGGTFYSIQILPEPWQTITLFNPVVYLVSGFRWSFYGAGDVPVAISLAMICAFLIILLGLITWIFKTGYKIRH